MPLIPQRAKTRQKTKPRRRPAEPRRALRKTSMWRNMPILHPGTAARRALHKTRDRTCHLHPRPHLRAHSGMPGYLPPGAFLIGLHLGPVFTQQKGPHAGSPFPTLCIRQGGYVKTRLFKPSNLVFRTRHLLGRICL